MLRQDAPFEFGIEFMRSMPHNDDGTIPGPENIFGGVGPFDFSGVADDTAVVLKIKDDADTVQDLTVDVSGAVDTSAVTVDELVTALTTTFTALDYTASKAEGKDGSDRLKIVSTASPLPTWIQVYGEFAEIAKIGQGLGLKFVKFDTLKTAGLSPVLKEDEEFVTTDSHGRDTSINALGYQKGVTVTNTDSASNDEDLLKLMMGWTDNDTDGGIDSGTSETDRVTFFCEYYWAEYSKGTNQEDDIVGYVRNLVRNATGVAGDATHERGWTDGNFTINGLNYTDASGNLLGAVNRKELTRAEYAALDVLNV